MPRKLPSNGGLLPHYRRALMRVRVDDLGLSYRAMALALSGTEYRPLLIRGDRSKRRDAAVDHTTVRYIELEGRGWPRNPDAWIAAYAELAGVTPLALWTRALEDWAKASAYPEAIALAKRLRP